MKQLFLLFVVLLMVCSCSDEILNEENHQAILGASNVTFSFDSITSPANWRTYQSLEEMLEACQIPEDKLSSMSTDELIEVCMSHPLHSIYFAYDNELDGAKVVFENFNGFQELKRRRDAPEKVIDFYSDVNFNTKAKHLRRKNFSKFTYIGFIELYLASKELPDLYKGSNLMYLERISNEVLDMKLAQPVKKMHSISRSLLINSQIAIERGNLSQEDEKVLKAFVLSGGKEQDPQVYTTVSTIISK